MHWNALKGKFFCGMEGKNSMFMMRNVQHISSAAAWSVTTEQTYRSQGNCGVKVDDGGFLKDSVLGNAY